MIILVDGRSGAGKSVFARELAAGLDGAQVVSLDDVYPGWAGLAAGSDSVAGILSSHRWREWDWANSAPGQWHELDPDRHIIVEGVGAITRASLPFADRSIWLELDASNRKRRALARDGEMFAPHWNDWAIQEDALIARENPAALAGEIRRVEP